MAVWTAWPENASAGSPSYAAADFRRVEAVWHTPHPSGSARPLGATSGRTPFSWLVTLSGSTISIAPGAGVLDVETTATTGAYRVASDSIDTSLTATAAAGSTRIDGVYIQLDDTDVDGSTFRKAIPVYLAGTAGSGTPPTSPPARSLRIATITVPSSGLGSAVVAAEPLFTVALGGTLPVANLAAAPTSPYEGQKIYTLDTNLQYFYNGSAWKGQPAGQIAYGVGSAGSYVSPGNIVSLSVPFVAGRLYKITGTYQGVQTTATGTVSSGLSGTGIPSNSVVLASYGAGITAYGSTPVYFAPSATGSVTVNLTIQVTVGGSQTVSANQVFLIVEDVGTA